jgi:3-methyladenine DNA glycosylase Tag
VAEQFSQILARAAERKGGLAAVKALTSKPLTAKQLLEFTAADWLAAFSKKVFQSGFVWRIVEQKWPGFNEVFFDFSPEKILMLSDEKLAEKAQDPRIIRNGNKVLTIRANAQMIYELSLEHGSFSALIANWPSDDIISLWALLKKRGARLGGNTGAYALRAMGKDTFLLSQDIEAYFRGHQLIDGGLTSLGNLRKIQAQFNEWQQQSGLSYQELSRIVAMSVGDNSLGMADAPE